MPTIDRLELFHVAVPLEAPFYPAWIPGYPQTECRFTLLKMTTADGVVGWAAGNAFESEREGLGSLLGPYLLGMDPTDIPRVRQLLRPVDRIGLYGSRRTLYCPQKTTPSVDSGKSRGTPR